MIPLRQLFLVDRLRAAAESGEPAQLRLVREIIKRIKLIQLEHMAVATDEMILELLQKLRAEKERELALIERHLEEAMEHRGRASDRDP